MWQERHDGATYASPTIYFCPRSSHPTHQNPGTPAGLQTRRLLQHVQEKGWQTPPVTIGMSCSGLTLLEGGGDVVDAVVVCTDTHS